MSLCRRRLLFCLPLSLSVTPLPACSQGIGGCDESGCSDRLSVPVEITAPDGLSPGTYVVIVTTDVDSATLTCTVDNYDDPGSCEGYTEMINEDEEVCSSDHSCLRIVLEPPLEEVTVEVRSEAVDLAPITFAPRYETQYPNGPDCPGSCKVGVEETITL